MSDYSEALQYTYHDTYRLIDDYVYPEDVEGWLDCPVCHAKPKVWIFDNGCSTGCKCHNNKYDHFSIHAESVKSHWENDQSVARYTRDNLRQNWNTWVKTGKIVFPHASKRNDNRW